MHNRVESATSTKILLTGVLGLAEFSRGALVVALLSNYVTGPLGAPLTVAGVALSAHYFLDTMFRGPSGWMVDRWGSKRVLMAGLAIEVVSLFGMMSAKTAMGAVAFVALLGVGTATHWPAVVTGTNRLSGQASRASAMSIVFAAWLAGSGLGPMVINFIMHGRDRTAFVLLILVDLAAWSLAVALQNPELEPRRPAHHPIREWVGTLWPFRFILPGMFLQNMTLGLMLPVLEPYVNRVLHLSHWQFAGLLTGGGAITVALLWPMGRATDRFGLRLPLIGGFFVAALALSMLAFTRHFYALVALGGVLGFSYAMILPSWNAFLGQLVPREIEGWHWGVFMTVEGLGMAVGPLVGTRLFEVAVWAPFLFSAGVLLVMGLFYWLFPFDAYWAAR
ncbi:MFS transporter [Sulfobacillus harzensis]|uniref:MFS transporter n=1 Tax=Sulfobacillus harzensis TaxID=2729629 RepID=A0A7Y0Q3C0_9FIRM|nr:MFS transporter [Sulfobacillus harzensis]NMP23402.1 MFS transporter [Sulfobacillus harzensis]